MPQVGRGGHVRAVAEGQEPAVGRVVQRVRGTYRRQHGQHRHGDQARDEQDPRAQPGSATDGQQARHHTAGAEQRGQPERVGDQVRGHVPDRDLPGRPDRRHHQGRPHPAAAYQGGGDHDQDGDADPGRGHHGETAAAARPPGFTDDQIAASGLAPAVVAAGGLGSRRGGPEQALGDHVTGRARSQGGQAGGLARRRCCRVGLRLQGRNFPCGTGVAAHCPLAVGARLIASSARRRRRPASAENSRNFRMNGTKTKDPQVTTELFCVRNTLAHDGAGTSDDQDPAFPLPLSGVSREGARVAGDPWDDWGLSD